MVHSKHFDERHFRRSVDKALKSVAQILKVHRQPQLAEHVDHTYDDKYALVDTLSNVAIIAQINVLAGLGLTTELLEQFCTNEPSSISSSSITLRFQASESVEFQKKEHVRVGSGDSLELEVTEFTSGSTGTSRRSLLSKVMKRAKEYHWRVTTEWEISIYTGTNVEERKILQSRSVTRTIVTQIPEPKFSSAKVYPPLETSLDFLMQNIEDGTTAAFQIDRQVSKTPRRNEQVETMLTGVDAMSIWMDGVARHLHRHIVRRFLYEHNPVHKNAEDVKEKGRIEHLMKKSPDVFCPIQPLLEDYKERTFVDVAAVDSPKGEPPRKMALALPEAEHDDSPLLSVEDYFSFLGQHVASLEEACRAEHEWCPKKDNVKKFITKKEVEIVLHCRHSAELGASYRRAVQYVEQMLRNQLVSAIGKEVDQYDIDKFVKHNHSKLLAKPPQSFCHVVRRPEHSPEGILCIEGKANRNNDEYEPVETFVRESNCGPILVPLDAAASLELRGRVLLHGWLRHPFQGTNETYQLTARARQFSCFVLLIGTMASGSEFKPKDALIVRNKDELIIPLLLKDIPSPKEFKDAISSLSPEQQRFAKAFRGMQLGSSVFGVCVVQIKPQLEKLLGLPADSLTKEMKLTQDLIELFIEYQVPSDMLSFDGNADNNPTANAMVDKVKGHVGCVMGVIDGAWNKQLGDEVKKCIARNAMADDDICEEDDCYSLGLRRSGFLGDTIDRELDRARRQEASDEVSCASGGSDMYGEEEYDEEECDVQPGPRGGGNTEDEAGGVPDQKYTDRSSPGQVGHPSKDGKETGKRSSETTKLGLVSPTGGNTNVDFATIPKRVNEAFGKLDKNGSLRSCTVSADTETWRRRRQENLLVKSEAYAWLNSDDLKSETNRALDLLDALSRSGTLPIEASELHVVVAASHRFQNDVMGTVIEDNVNPIEKLEKSALTFISAVHGESAGSLVRDPIRLRQLAVNFPDLLPAEDATSEPATSDGCDGDFIPVRPDGWHELL